MNTITQNPYLVASATSALSGELDGCYSPRLLELHGRIGRLRYLAYIMAAGAVAGLIMLLAAYSLPSTLTIPVVAVVEFAMLPLAIIFGRRRLLDMDKSGWWLLLLIVPVLNLGLAIYLHFFPGSSGPNRFGPPAVPNTGLIIAAAIAATLLATIGTIALFVLFSAFRLGLGH
ncbi:MAG: DUF805 domain-containing protein [Massilia sp.]